MSTCKKKQIKCVVWDLDETIWTGTLSEGDRVALIPEIKNVILELDRRGIIQSIASKNNFEMAMHKLKQFGINEYFLCPQISWNNKSDSIREILEILNLKPEAVAFIDDNPFERDEVRYIHPNIQIYDAAEGFHILELPEFQVRFITQDAKNRRKMYQADILRQQAEKVFAGSNEEFLETLGMKLDIRRVTETDLQRVEELTVRTHQLNSTGYTYSYEELLQMAESPNYIFCICGLTDRYGDSGKVGLLLMERGEEIFKLKLLIVSCRVMSRGIGTALLCYATQLAFQCGKKLQADFLETEHNRIMYITYKLNGFEEISENGNKLCLQYMEDAPLELPDYLMVDRHEIEGNIL